MLTTKIIELEMSAQPKRGFTEVKQNDADGVQLRLTLRNSDYTAYLIPDGSVVSFLAVKSDKKSVVLSSTDDNPRVTYTANSNIVLVTLSAQVLAVAGIILCNISISKSGATTSTQTFTLSCAEALTADDLTSSSEFQSLSKMLADLTARKAEFDVMNDKIANMALGYGGTFATLAALQADANANTPDGKKRFYIVAANGHHYYWSNITSAWADGGAIIPYADVTALKEGITNIGELVGYGVRNDGLKVIPTEPPSYAVNVSGDTFYMPDGRIFNISGQLIILEPGDMMNARIDIIYVSSAGELCYLAGEPGAGQPDTPEGGILIAVLDAMDGASPITVDRITDMRPISVLHSTAYDETYNNVVERFKDTEEKVNDLIVKAAQTDAELAALRAAQAQMSNDTRIDLSGTGKATAIPKNAAVLGVGGTIKGMTITPLVAQSNVAVGGSVSFASVSGNKYYDSLHKTILTGTGSTMTVTNDTTAVANINVIDLTAHGLQNKTAAEILQICPNYISGNQSAVPMRLRSINKNWFDVNKVPSVTDTTGGTVNVFNDGNYVYVKGRTGGSGRIFIIGHGYEGKVGSGASPSTLPFITGPGTYKFSEAGGKLPQRIYYDNTYTALDSYQTVITAALGIQGFGYYFDSNTDVNLALKIQLETGNTSTTYEPHKETACYIEPRPMRRLPNGVCDTVALATGKRIINVFRRTLLASDIVSITTTYTNIDVVIINKPTDFIYYNVGGWDKAKMQALYIDGFTAAVEVSDDASTVYTMFNLNATSIGLVVPKGLYANISAAQAALSGREFMYQLANPAVENNVVTGTLVSYPKGLILCEPVIADAGIYNNGITILRTDYPIQSLETLCKINIDGTQTPLDVSAATITDAGTKITHPALSNGDIVAFTYFTASSGIIGENVFNYVNANGLTLGADGRYYKVGFAIDASGNISLTKTEVV